jgi:radical SAM protein with 4Fe4S-binding SPASM domain
MRKRNMKVCSVINYGKRQLYEKYWSFRTNYKYIPYYAMIELTTRCNAKCIYCGRDKIPFVQDMSLDMFKKIVDALPFVKEIVPQGSGESTLHPDLVEAIKYANSKGKKTVLFTNASLLTEALSRELLESGLNRIAFSVDTDNKKDYEAIRPPLKWDTLLNNIKQFVEMRDEGYKTTIQVNMVETNYNFNRYWEIVHFWKNIVDMVSFTHARSFDEAIKKVNRPMHCYRIEEELVIKSNGDVVMCCEDWYHQYKIGEVSNNITAKQFLEMFNYGLIASVRKSLKRGCEYPDLCDICLPRMNQLKEKYRI